MSQDLFCLCRLERVGRGKAGGAAEEPKDAGDAGIGSKRRLHELASQPEYYIQILEYHHDYVTLFIIFI